MSNFAQRGSARGGPRGGFLSSSRGDSGDGYRGARGGGRGRGSRGGFRGSANRVWPPPEVDRPGDLVITEGLSPSSLETLVVPTVAAATSSFSGALQENVEYLGSYNFIGSDGEPTILVPGAPPVWNNPRVPFTLRPDVGERYIDQNSYRVPACSYYPMFAAIDTMGTAIAWPSIDVVTSRNALRKLLRWIDGNTTRDFRIDLELAGDNTLFFFRWEKRNREKHSGKTFGFTFEEETTNAAKGCKGSIAHHRIIKYDYFGLRMVVVFEVDACAREPSAGNQLPRKDNTDGLDSLLNSMSIGSANASASGSANSTAFPVKVIKAGAEVVQEDVIELTTRSIMNIGQFDWTEQLPQLYLSATPKLFIGVHQRGTFQEIQEHDLNDAALMKMRRDAAASYEKLGRALEAIQALVVEHGPEEHLSLLCKDGVLKVYRRIDGKSRLPADLRERFAASE
ncbi:hypothetical protein PENSPDRAFT_637695 [Peniophora sp. CONT]|nr:hypothetical protein PENSPDRAFT_637695 [Peniophora sp. CONT]